MGDDDIGKQKTTGGNWGDLRARLLSAAALIPIVAAAIIIGHLAVALLIAAVLVVAFHEWSMMANGKVGSASYFSMGMLALSAVSYPLVGFWVSFALFIATAVLSGVVHKEYFRWPSNGIAAGFLGFAGLCVLALRGDTNLGILATVFLTVVIWLTDSGAFFAGRQFGGRKLAPEISPSKTWSGAIGGLIVGTMGGVIVWILGWLTVPDMSSPLWIGILISAAISIFAQLGDLAESALKRHFLIKDSGQIIPGHGGILDRIDSFTVGAILLYFIGVAHITSEHVARGVLIW